jgi:hypothetical protein
MGGCGDAAAGRVFMNSDHVGKGATRTSIRVSGLHGWRDGAAERVGGVIDVVEDTLGGEPAEDRVTDDLEEIGIESIVSFGKEYELGFGGISSEGVESGVAVGHQPLRHGDADRMGVGAE